ncbi:MAG: hypothetical protein J5843_02940 [Clostridia bacterium]|nr:hypothetical protein [Clostridia bacterium]
MSQEMTEQSMDASRVERIGEFPAGQLSDLFTSLGSASKSGQDRMILMYVRDGKIVCDRTDLGYLAERNRKRAESAFAKGLVAGKAESSKAKFRDGYFIGYREGKDGRPCRDPDAENPDESLTSCDFRCRLCVYACPSCGHCTYYDRKETVSPEPETQKAETEKTETGNKKNEHGKGRRKQL